MKFKKITAQDSKVKIASSPYSETSAQKSLREMAIKEVSSSLVKKKASKGIKIKLPSVNQRIVYNSPRESKRVTLVIDEFNNLKRSMFFE